MKNEWVARVYEKIGDENRLIITMYSEEKSILLTSISHHLEDYFHDGKCLIEIGYEMTEEVSDD